jgi:D-alanine-D-alanine ligase
LKVAVVYNPDARGIINVFGIQNREWYPQETIQRAVTALEKAGHEVNLIPADRLLLAKLKKFLKGLSKRRPNGIVLNMALGIQGKCRYTHVPAMLEAAGVPYTGSSPLGHILALDKVVAKQIFNASGLPTPNHQVFSDPDQRVGNLQFPLIVKPRGEAASFGLRIVESEVALKEAVDNVLTDFKQTALVEEFIEGREMNVGVLGNNPPEAFPVLELLLGGENNKVYTHEAKFAKSARKKARKVCPADLPAETAAYLRKLAIQAFQVLHVYDFARVDFRLDAYNQPYVLEVNSMASLNPGSSFVYGARAAGYTYDRLINRIAEVACERYASEEPDYFGPKNSGWNTGATNRAAKRAAGRRGEGEDGSAKGHGQGGRNVGSK